VYLIVCVKLCPIVCLIYLSKYGCVIMCLSSCIPDFVCPILCVYLLVSNCVCCFSVQH